MQFLKQWFKGFGSLVLVAPVLYAFWLSLSIVHAKFGLLVSVISFFLAPLTIVVVPLYSGIFDGNWTPALFAFTLPTLVVVISILVMTVSKLTRTKK